MREPVHWTRTGLEPPSPLLVQLRALRRLAAEARVAGQLRRARDLEQAAAWVADRVLYPSRDWTS